MAEETDKPEVTPEPTPRGTVPVSTYFESEEEAEPSAAEAEPTPAEEPEAAPAEGEVQETEAAAETEPEAEETPEPPAAEKPLPPAIDPQIVQRAAQAEEFDLLLRQDPELRKSYLRSLKARGVRLHPSDEALLSPEAAAKPAAPAGPTEEEISKKAQEMVMRGDEIGAQKLIAEWKVQQLIGPVQAKLEAAEKRQTEALRAAKDEALAAGVRAECVELAKKYPDLAVIDDKQPMGVKFKDQKFFEELIEMSRGINHAAALPVLADVVLARQGKLGVIKPGTPAKALAAGKPPLKPAPRPPVKKPAPVARGMVPVTVTIEQ